MKKQLLILALCSANLFGMHTSTSIKESSDSDLIALADQTMLELEREKLLDRTFKDFQLYEEVTELGWQEIRYYADSRMTDYIDKCKRGTVLDYSVPKTVIEQKYLPEMKPIFYRSFYRKFRPNELPRLKKMLEVLLSSTDNEKERSNYTNEINLWDDFRQFIFKQVLTNVLKDTQVVLTNVLKDTMKA